VGFQTTFDFGVKMVKEKLYKKTKRYRPTLKVDLAVVILLMIGLSGTMLVVGYSINPNNEKPGFICYDVATLNQTLNKISEKCGSTLFLKEYGSDNWSVFVTTFKETSDGTIVKQQYVPVSQCLGDD
jgi:hypothetical protein